MADESLVDSGVIQIALGVAAGGFLLRELGTPEMADKGLAVFVMASFAAVGFYFIYFVEWVERFRGVRREHPFFHVVFLWHVVLLMALFALMYAANIVSALD